MSGQDESARPRGGVRRRARAAPEHAQGHEHLRAQPHVGPGERPGVGGAGALGAREAQARRRAGAQEGSPQGGESGGACPGRRSRRSPTKRRRTAAEVAQVEAQAQAEKAAELAALELERPVVELEEPAPAQSLEERARALFKDLPPAPAEPEVEIAPRPMPAAPRAERRGVPPGRAGERDAARPFIPAAHPAAACRSVAAVPSRSSAVARPRAHPPIGGGAAAPPARTFGPDAEKGGGRKKGKKGKRSSVDQDAVQANILKTLAGHEGSRGTQGPPERRAVVPRGAGRPCGGGARAGEDPDSRQRVHHRLRARAEPEGSRHADRRVRVQEPGPDGHHQPAARLRPDRADRVRVRLPGGAGGRVRRRDRGRGGTGHAGAAGLAAAGRHDHGSRRPRQDVAARLHPEGQRRRRRGGRHHAAHRRVPRHAAGRARSRSSTRRATRRSPPCARAARR